MEEKFYKISITISWPDDYYYEIYPDGYLVIEFPHLVSEKMLKSEINHITKVLFDSGPCYINNYVLCEKIKDVCIFEINTIPQVQEIKKLNVDGNT